MDSSGTEGRLRAHVEALAGTIGERHLLRPHALAAAADYIDAAWQAQGYVPERETFTVDGVDCANLVITRPGRLDELLLIGAHYDTVRGSPGADDNASGVAALLELSRAFTAVAPSLTVRFVAFTNEEPPFFFTRQQGSVVHARAARARGERIALMISLEMLGYFDDRPGSQRYPPLFRWFYPDRGDFLGFVSDLRSRHRCSERPQLFAPRPNSRSRPAPPSAGSRASAGATTGRSGGRATEPSWSPTRPFTAIPTTHRR